jgi:hypothetical protein
MLDRDFQDDSSVSSEDGHDNKHDPPPVHVGEQGNADAAPPADVFVLVIKSPAARGKDNFSLWPACRSDY